MIFDEVAWGENAGLDGRPVIEITIRMLRPFYVPPLNSGRRPRATGFGSGTLAYTMWNRTCHPGAGVVRK